MLKTGDGSVYSWGRGMFGRLGTGCEADELIPTRVKFELDKNGGEIDKVKIVGIAAGSYHSLALAGIKITFSQIVFCYDSCVCTNY